MNDEAKTVTPEVLRQQEWHDLWMRLIATQNANSLGRMFLIISGGGSLFEDEDIEALLNSEEMADDDAKTIKEAIEEELRIDLKEGYSIENLRVIQAEATRLLERDKNEGIDYDTEHESDFSASGDEGELTSN